MEDFGARGATALETCLAELEACDVCVLLLDYYYGTIVPRYNASYTETEYEHARLTQVEVLGISRTALMRRGLALTTRSACEISRSHLIGR